MATLRRPRRERRQVEPDELGSLGNAGPQLERPLQVLERLGQPEDGFRLACRRDRGDQRLRRPSGGRPVLGELRRDRVRRARELRGQPRVEFLALARQQRPVDRLGQQRVPEPEGAGRWSPTSTPCSTARRNAWRSSPSGSLATARSRG